MDILHLIDRLEELFNESRPIPFTHNVIVDEDRTLDIIDQMRVTVPEEVKKARQVLAHHERILAQAQEESTRTLSLAREKSKHLIEKDAIVIAAKAHADNIRYQAHIDAEQTRRDADKYVIQILSRMEIELEQLLNQTRNGILALEDIAQVDPASKYPKVTEENNPVLQTDPSPGEENT